MRGDDTRRRSPDRRRLHARQHEYGTKILLVRSDRQRSRKLRIAPADDRDVGRRGQALRATGGGGYRYWRRRDHDHAADRAAILVANVGTAGGRRRYSLA